MTARRRGWLIGGALAIAAATAVPVAVGAAQRTEGAVAHRKQVLDMGDSRIKFEINATDGDGGVQVFIDADQWEKMSIYDPNGKRIFTSTAKGRMAEQGGTELFLESAEPPFTEVTLDELLDRWPEGEYRFRGASLEGDRYEGSWELTHDLPDGPTLVFPLEGDPPQDPDDTTVTWEPVAPPNGSPIIAYQVLVVEDGAEHDALPTVALDIIMPPDATSLTVPAGFLLPDTEYEWEVLAIESSGNQTLSSSFFTTAG
ncbi:MAG: fibronectin type III domain-containing protein [Ilumatobacter sp.]|nr:fibronectin type III domain-containing protein [Ilumatobacter sp.]